MADQNDPQMTRDDANIHLGFTYLREDLQEMRQDLRELTREMNRRFEDVNRCFDDMAQRMDHRFNRQTATVIALAAAIIAAVRL
jgi:RNA polymerase-binding transcription factor DksA